MPKRETFIVVVVFVFLFSFFIKIIPSLFSIPTEQRKEEDPACLQSTLSLENPERVDCRALSFGDVIHSSTLRFLLSTETFRSKNPLLDVRLRQKCELFRGLPQIWCLVDLRRRVGRMAPTAWRTHSRRVAVLTRICVFVSLDYP